MSMAAGQNPLSSLRRILETRFDLGELRSICDDLGIDYENLVGARKTDKARELVAVLNRRNRIPDLIEIGRQDRLDIDRDRLPASDTVWTTFHIADLEQSMRQSYSWIREYEDIIRLSDRPKEKLRAKREIEEQ